MEQRFKGDAAAGDEAGTGETPPPVLGPRDPPAGRPSTGAGPAGDPAGRPPAQPASASRAIRASDQERDEVVHLLRNAFAEGRLDDDEFDARMNAALGARVRTDLDRLVSDLPAGRPPRPLEPSPQIPADGRFAVAIKGWVRRTGCWRVPRQLTTFAYKGGAQIDLRVAELTAPVTAIRALGYKSDVEIIVPPGVRVVIGGFGVSRHWPGEQRGGLPPDAPMVHVRGFAYRGRIEVRSTPRLR